jgi:hypothetical protein
MTAFFDATQIYGALILVADDKADHLHIEIAARWEISGRDDDMACARNIERWIKCDGRNFHNDTLYYP